MSKKTKKNKTHAIEDLPTNYLTCRTFGHSWEEFIPVGMRKPQIGFRFSLLCVSCGCERHDLMNQRGEVVQREYRYPDAYEVSFRAARDEYRIQLNRRKRKRARRGTQVIEVSA